MKGLGRIPRKRGRTPLWNPVFSACRPLLDSPLVQNREGILQDVESAIPSWQEDAFQGFLNAGNSQCLQNPARARLDDRAHITGERRKYDQEWLTPEVLRGLLLAEVGTVPRPL
jgi:hypothetical protein